MKKAFKAVLSLFILVSFYGCPSDSGSDENENEDVFYVEFEKYVPVIENSDGTYNISNGGFRAYFEAQSGATAYELTNIREDDSRGSTRVRTEADLDKVNGQLAFFIGVGSIRVYLDANESTKNEAVAFFMNQLAEAEQHYAKLEVKVIR